MNEIPDQGSESHYQTLEAMRTYGGGFVKALAEVWARADGANHMRLFSAFNDYHKQYSDMAKADKDRTVTKRRTNT